MDKREEGIEMSMMVASKLDDALSAAVEEAIKAGINITDRSLMNGLTSTFLEGMALTIDESKWKPYLDSLLNETSIRELRKLRDNARFTVEALKAQLGAESEDDIYDKVREVLSPRRGDAN